MRLPRRNSPRVYIKLSEHREGKYITSRNFVVHDATASKVEKLIRGIITKAVEAEEEKGDSHP